MPERDKQDPPSIDDGQSLESSAILASPFRDKARMVMRHLPPNFKTASLTCPLCSHDGTARGLRTKPLRGVDAAKWQVIYTCSACGLVTSFDVEHFSVEQINALGGNNWTKELRRFSYTRRSDLLYERHVGFNQLATTFLVSFGMWLLLTGSFAPLDMGWGALVCLLVARLTYGYAAFDPPKWMRSLRRWRAFIRLMIEFLRQLIVQNVTLSLRVFAPRLSIRPGIVAVPTRLRDDVQLTILFSLMTLTPDTVTMDVDQKRGLMYVHWIDVQATNPQEIQRLMSASLEDKIIEWLWDDRAQADLRAKMAKDDAPMPSPPVPPVQH